MGENCAFVRRAGGLLPPNIIKFDFRLRKFTEIIHFSLFDIHYSLNIQCSVRDPATACRAPRSTPLRSAQDDTDGIYARTTNGRPYKICANIVCSTILFI